MCVCLSVGPDCRPVGCCGVSLHGGGLQLLQEVLQQKWGQGHARHEMQWHAHCELKCILRHTHTRSHRSLLLHIYINTSIYPLYLPVFTFLTQTRAHTSFPRCSDWDGQRRILTVILIVKVRTASRLPLPFHKVMDTWIEYSPSILSRALCSAIRNINATPPALF